MTGLAAPTRLVMTAVVVSSLFGAADFSTYRGFQFGASLAATAEQAGLRPADARIVHRRPELIQELRWRTGLPYGRNPDGDESVQEALLRFYDGKLFQIVVRYNRQKVEGLTEEDMVEAISSIYGTATRPQITVLYSTNYGEVASVLARWENTDYSYDLVRTGDRTSFAMILSSKSLNRLAQTAIAEAQRLDVVEGPQNAIDLRNKQAAEESEDLGKARSESLSTFRP